MHLFVPFDDSELARIALADACRTLTPLDHLTVMAAIIVVLILLPIGLAIFDPGLSASSTGCHPGNCHLLP